MNQAKIVDRINERLDPLMTQLRHLVAGFLVSEIQVLDCEKEADPYESLESCRAQKRIRLQR